MAEIFYWRKYFFRSPFEEGDLSASDLKGYNKSAEDFILPSLGFNNDLPL
jgi:hypothetical protein